MKIYQWTIYDRAENHFTNVQGTDITKVCRDTYNAYKEIIEELREQNDLCESDTNMIDNPNCFATEGEYWIARVSDLHIVIKSNFFEVGTC